MGKEIGLTNLAICEVGSPIPLPVTRKGTLSGTVFSVEEDRRDLEGFVAEDVWIGEAAGYFSIEGVAGDGAWCEEFDWES